MSARIVALSLLCLMAQGSAAANDDLATVLDGRRLFFDDATRRRTDAGIAKQKVLPTGSRPARDTGARLRSTGTGSRDVGSINSGVTGRATVDGRLGRQHIVDGVPLQSDSP